MYKSVSGQVYLDIAFHVATKDHYYIVCRIIIRDDQVSLFTVGYCK